MRDTDKPDDGNKPLGPPIRKPEMPEPHRKVGDGVWKAPDGKMYTVKPENELANMPDFWRFYGFAKP